MPGQSGTVMTVGNVFGLVGGLIPLGLGLVVERFDLTVTMWLLLPGPLGWTVPFSTLLVAKCRLPNWS